MSPATDEFALGSSLRNIRAPEHSFTRHDRQCHQRYTVVQRWTLVCRRRSSTVLSRRLCR